MIPNYFTQVYSEEVMDHVRNPRNMGKMRKADAEAIMGNPTCGDVMKFSIRVGKKNGEAFIKDVKFQTLGCGAAIATSSMMTVLVKGKSLDQAKKITKQMLVGALNGLPPVKVHCSTLANEVLKKAINNYELGVRKRN